MYNSTSVTGGWEKRLVKAWSTAITVIQKPSQRLIGPVVWPVFQQHPHQLSFLDF